MIDQEVRKHIEELAPDTVFFANPSFDGSIVGMDSTYQRLVYDYDLMVEEYMQDEGCDQETAEDFIQYNTLNSLTFPGAPIVLMHTVW